MDTTTGSGREIIVDVRDQLRAGKEPFSEIMQAAESCTVGDTLVLLATFKPVPLLMMLKGQGFDGKATKVGKGDWRVDFLRVRGKKRAGHDVGSAASGGPKAAAAPGAIPTPTAIDAPGSANASGATLQTALEDIELNNRGLEPPEPMVRTLEAVYNLQPGQRIVGKFDRTPMFMLPKLEEMGYLHEIETEPDGRTIVTIWQGPKND